VRGDVGGGQRIEALVAQRLRQDLEVVAQRAGQAGGVGVAVDVDRRLSAIRRRVQQAGDVPAQHRSLERLLLLAQLGRAGIAGIVHAGTADRAACPWPTGLYSVGQAAQVTQVGRVQRIGAADRQRHAMHHHRPAGADTVQVLQRLAAGHQVVFADHRQLRFQARWW